MEDTTVLCLRGGGADAKRRDARKRKFAHLQIKFPQVTSQGEKDVADTGKSADEEAGISRSKASKRRKLDSSVTQPRESKTTPSEPNDEENMDVDASKNESTGKTAKSQRFICFVGKSFL